MNPDKILDLAQKEIGIKESPIGSGNVKYNTAYYGRVVSGGSYAWCAVFLWWLYREAGAPELYFGGKKTASCGTLLDHYKSTGQTVTDYQPGDIIFFDGLTSKGFNDIPDHVGICESFDGTHITTIDGNTSGTNEANGGTVARRKRLKKYILAAARPAYQMEEEDEPVTQQEFDAMMADWMKRRGELPASPWAAEGLAQAKTQGITDGTRPRSFATREEVAQMMVNAGK